jgi:hypothetical protein
MGTRIKKRMRAYGARRATADVCFKNRRSEPLVANNMCMSFASVLSLPDHLSNDSLYKSHSTLSTTCLRCITVHKMLYYHYLTDRLSDELYNIRAGRLTPSEIRHWTISAASPDPI